MTPRLLQAQTGTPAPSPDAAKDAAQRTLGIWDFMPFVVIAVLFYFILIAPQRKQQKQRDDMLKTIKKNDHVLTNSGIYGIVQRADANEVVLIIDEKKDVRIRVARSAIAGVEKVAGGESASESREA